MQQTMSDVSVKRMLLHLETELRSRAAKFKRHSGRLLFQYPPDPVSQGELPHRDHLPMVLNQGGLPLRANLPENTTFLDYQAWLLESHSEVEYIPTDYPHAEVRHARNRLISAVERELEALEVMKEKEWIRQRDEQRVARQKMAAGIPIFNTGE